MKLTESLARHSDSITEKPETSSVREDLWNNTEKLSLSVLHVLRLIVTCLE